MTRFGNVKCDVCGHRWWIHYQTEDHTHWVCDGEDAKCSCVRYVYESTVDPDEEAVKID